MESSDQQVQERDYFYERYSHYSDSEILDVLRDHKNYQENAIDMAVKIAIERQLINSEQDLFAPEFQKQSSTSFGLFPEIKAVYHRERVAASIFRFVFLMALVPVIGGTLKYAEGNINYAWIGWGTGVLWFLLSLAFRQTKKKAFVVLLIILLVLASSVALWQLIGRESFLFLDLAIWIIATLLPLYLLVYLARLLKTSNA